MSEPATFYLSDDEGTLHVGTMTACVTALEKWSITPEANDAYSVKQLDDLVDTFNKLCDKWFDDGLPEDAELTYMGFTIKQLKD